MALKAYTGHNRTGKIVDAKKVPKANKKDTYYCITEHCNGEFYYRNRNGRDSVTKPTSPEPLSYCNQHHKLKRNFNDYKDEGFSFLSILSNVSKKPSKNPYKVTTITLAILTHQKH